MGTIFESAKQTFKTFLKRVMTKILQFHFGGMVATFAAHDNDAFEFNVSGERDVEEQFFVGI
jgi:hypothetical protein